MSDYTPSVADGQSYYVAGRAQIQRQITGEHAQDITPYSYEFDRMIAQVRAETLREARDNVRASSFWADGSDNYADRVRGYLSRAADRIEKEAGL